MGEEIRTWGKDALDSASEITRLPLGLDEEALPVLGGGEIDADPLIHHFGGDSHHAIEDRLPGDCRPGQQRRHDAVVERIVRLHARGFHLVVANQRLLGVRGGRPPVHKRRVGLQVRLHALLLHLLHCFYCFLHTTTWL